MGNIVYNYNKEKALEVLLYLANKNCAISVIRLMKILFFADIEHLKRYTRPILGNIYVAMPLGPVLSALYDDIKKSSFLNKSYAKKENAIVPNRQANIDYLSKSDIEVLDYIFEKYKDTSTEDLIELTHQHKAWLNAKAKLPNSKNAPMDWLDMVEDEEIKECVIEQAGVIAF